MSLLPIRPSDGSRRRAPTDAHTNFAAIAGIGDKKLEHYGDELIALVRTAGT